MLQHVSDSTLGSLAGNAFELSSCSAALFCVVSLLAEHPVLRSEIQGYADDDIDIADDAAADIVDGEGGDDEGGLGLTQSALDSLDELPLAAEAPAHDAHWCQLSGSHLATTSDPGSDLDDVWGVGIAAYDPLDLVWGVA